MTKLAPILAIVLMTFVAQSDFWPSKSAQAASAPKGSFSAVVKNASPELEKAYRAFRQAWKEGHFREALLLSNYALKFAQKEFGEESVAVALVHLDLMHFIYDPDWYFHPDKLGREEADKFHLEHMEKYVLISLKTEFATDALSIVIFGLAEEYIKIGRCEEATNLLKVPQLLVNPKIVEILEIPKLRAKAATCIKMKG